MSFAIPPDVQVHITEGVAWLWGQYGQKLIEKTTERAANEAKWRWSVERYYTSLFERVGFVRILGRMEAEPLENIFTHVNVLDRLSAERRYDVARLMAEFGPRDFSWPERVKRLPGEKAVDEFPKLFILGKPGAGKTTFLKHTALRAINREIKKVPIFVTLKELSDSGQAILPFIIRQFEVHRFPEPAPFVEKLLKDGNALVLFDGLDEVNLEGNRRADMIRALNDFTYQYGDCPILLTCRVAATDYSFTQFEYVEMADFDKAQMGRYIDQWFAYDEVRRANCHQALLEDETNSGVRELAQTPLLLALLCLVYEERGEFPPNRDEIYDEATRALLVKWDSSRNIMRDTVYQQLSLKHKQKMLARIAAETFSTGEYFLPEKRVVALIEAYLQGVPGVDEPDGELVLHAMEAQHGIFVERAHRIHSFSHLTLQEYFAARYITDNEQRGTVKQLMQHVGDDSWREVFKLTAGMLDDTIEFFEKFLTAVAGLIEADSKLLALLDWASKKGTQPLVAYRPPALRALLLDHALNRAIEYSRATTLVFYRVQNFGQILDLLRAIAHDIDPTLDFALGFNRTSYLSIPFFARTLLSDKLNRALELAKKLDSTGFQKELAALSFPAATDDDDKWQGFAAKFITVLDKYENDWNPHQQIEVTDEDILLFTSLSEEQFNTWVLYLKANRLLVDCLKIAYVRDREAIEDQLLLPPALAKNGNIVTEAINQNRSQHAGGGASRTDGNYPDPL
jgi:hypothetical protein